MHNLRILTPENEILTGQSALDYIRLLPYKNRESFRIKFLRNHHYHVLIGLQGLYLPDSNYLCLTLQDAYELAAWEKDSWLESGCKAIGNIRKNSFLEFGNLYFGNDDNFCYIIEITKCQENDCILYHDDFGC